MEIPMNQMNQSSEAEVSLKLFEFIEREQALEPHQFSNSTGVLLAGEGLLRAAGHVPGSRQPKGWREAVDGFGRRAEDKKYTLRTIKLGDYWFVMRRTLRSNVDMEYLALAFDEVPLCAQTAEEAMRLADHCHPDPGQTIPGCWCSCWKT
jgi:hypothetical protein